MLVYLPKLAVPTRAVGCCLFSSRDAGSVDDVVRLRIFVSTLRHVRALAEGIGDGNRRPSSLPLCDVQGHRYCK